VRSMISSFVSPSNGRPAGVVGVGWVLFRSRSTHFKQTMRTRSVSFVPPRMRRKAMIPKLQTSTACATTHNI
jgi:hypothetical protein